MNFQRFENFSKYSKVLDAILQKNMLMGIPINELKFFIYGNLRIIMDQMQNVTLIENLSKKSLKLSNKVVEQFTNPAAHNLAFEIMGIANGVFSVEQEKKRYYA